MCYRYFTDPYQFNCKYDKVQNAIYLATSRAVAYAISKGVVVVAAAGNENLNFDTVSSDSSSPNNPPGTAITRPINSSCIQIPNQLPNVVSVASLGVKKLKSYFSNYSLKFIQVRFFQAFHCCRASLTAISMTSGVLSI